MKQTTAYIMDDPREGKRLAEKVNAAQWVKTYFEPSLDSARRVLDVGCGPCAIAAEIARAHPNLEVVGIDASVDRIEDAHRNLIGLPNGSARVGEAHALPFKDGEFDLVYCRLLLEYLPDKEMAVREMVRVCRPGGRVLLQDLDGQLVWHYPVDDELQAGIERTLVVLAKTGFDPFVGRKLYSLARTAGLQDIQVRVEPYHLFAGAIDDHNLRLWELKLDISLPAIAKALGNESEARRLKERFLDYLKRDDTLTYSVVFTVTGTKPI